MLYRRNYGSPLGEMTMVSDGKGLTALTFWGQKYDVAKAFEDMEGFLETGGGEGETVQKTGAAAEVLRGASTVFDRTKEWLDIYFSGHDPDFMPPLSPKGTSFQEEVWEILKRIPYGEVTSYGEIARQIAQKRGLARMSAQAVGGAVGRNPIAVIVPCHRVVGWDGKLTGYAGGLDKKEALLKLEKCERGRTKQRKEVRRNRS